MNQRSHSKPTNCGCELWRDCGSRLSQHRLADPKLSHDPTSPSPIRLCQLDTHAHPLHSTQLPSPCSFSALPSPRQGAWPPAPSPTAPSPPALSAVCPARKPSYDAPLTPLQATRPRSPRSPATLLPPPVSSRATRRLTVRDAPAPRFSRTAEPCPVTARR